MTRPVDGHDDAKCHYHGSGAAVDTSQLQQVAKRQRRNEDETRTMPGEIYPIIWSFLLDSNATAKPTDGGFIDFQSISSFMLVCRASKEAFHICRGWFYCAQALKREADAKLLVLLPFTERWSLLEQRAELMPEVFTTEFNVLFDDIRSWKEEMQRMPAICMRMLTIL
jgi:hypothetical protein